MFLSFEEFLSAGYGADSEAAFAENRFVAVRASACAVVDWVAAPFTNGVFF